MASLAHMQQVHQISQRAGVRVHLDGARMFNAAVALGVDAATLCQHADTVSLCLSKGLSAPMGAVLVGPKETIQRGRVLRKLLGASQRQVGIAAACGLEGLQSMVGRLADDHANARVLGEGLADIEGLRIRQPQTNIVQVDVSGTGMNAKEWVAALRDRQVLVRPWGPALLRCVTHRHIAADAIRAAIDTFAAIARYPAPM